MGLALRGPAFTTPGATSNDFAFAGARAADLCPRRHGWFPGSVETMDKLGLLGRTSTMSTSTSSVTRIRPDRRQRRLHLHFPVGGDADGTGHLSGDRSGHRRGIAAGLGVDTTTGTGTDLFTEMRLALAAERSRANAGAVSRDEAVEFVELNQRDVLRLATLDAARVWHLDHEVGSLTRASRRM